MGFCVLPAAWWGVLDQSLQETGQRQQVGRLLSNRVGLDEILDFRSDSSPPHVCSQACTPFAFSFWHPSNRQEGFQVTCMQPCNPSRQASKQACPTTLSVGLLATALHGVHQTTSLSHVVITPCYNIPQLVLLWCTCKWLAMHITHQSVQTDSKICSMIIS